MWESQLTACLLEQDSFEGDLEEVRMAHEEAGVDTVAESTSMWEALSGGGIM